MDWQRQARSAREQYPRSGLAAADRDGALDGVPSGVLLLPNPWPLPALISLRRGFLSWCRSWLAYVMHGCYEVDKSDRACTLESGKNDVTEACSKVSMKIHVVFAPREWDLDQVSPRLTLSVCARREA
jgi:hypothetical protein